MEEKKDVCCPKFNPEPWDGKTITWNNRQFIKDAVCCCFHIPLNMAGVMKRMMAKIEAAGAVPVGPDFVMLSEDVSNWKAVQYIAVTKEVPDAENVKLSGTFMAKVFEGPYKEAGKWHQEMQEYVKAQGKEAKKIYFYYTTCPKCAKKWGKNYVVVLAQIQ